MFHQVSSRFSQVVPLLGEGLWLSFHYLWFINVINGNETTSYSVPSDWIEGFKGAAKAFIDSIIKKESPDMDIDFSSQVLQVALAMYESSDTESTVHIKEV